MIFQANFILSVSMQMITVFFFVPLFSSFPFSRVHYNLNLESIAVNGQTVSINSSVFTTSDTQGTIVDSGTTLAYLAEEAFDPFVNAVSLISNFLGLLFILEC